MSLRSLVQAARIQWSWSHTSSVLIGAAIAYKDGYLHLPLLFWTWFGVELIHAATCMTNDYWDYLSGADSVGDHTMFNAGSRVIQEGKISPRLLLSLSFVLYALGAAIGVGLAIARGWTILILGVLGGCLGYFYTAPPLALCYRGLDQLALAICYGPLTILGSHFVQSQQLTCEALVVSVVYGITASMILYVKGFQDTQVDWRAGKESVIIMLGRERAARLFIFFFLAAYLLLFGGALLGILPTWIVIAGGSIPLVFRAQSALRDHMSAGNVQTFFRALVRTKMVHLYLGFLFIIGYALVGALAGPR